MEKREKKQWDAFVSYALEDQESFVRNLAAMLTRLGLSIWYAETALRVGDSLSASISKGLAESRYGIVVISPHFVAKKWTNWELAGLVNRQNSEEQNVILPIWHGVAKKEVIDFSPPLVDLFALNTTTEQANEIAFKLLHRIRPDIYGKYERAQLEKLANGEAMNDLQVQIEQVREELEAAKEDLAQYRCPYCEAPLSSRGDAPLDEEEKHWDVVEHFECGYSHFGGRVQSPCPADPKFPRFEEYDLRFSELKTDPFWKWSCVAFAKTQMATLLSLVHGLGQTQEEAAAQVRGSYDRYTRRGY
jgi:TIR domain